MPSVTAFLACAMLAGSAHADADSDRAAIQQRLQHWAQAFNARDAAGVCDIFATNLIATVPGVLDGSRPALCAKLATLLAKPGLRLNYAPPDIKEIIVSGDIAVVRLFWTLRARQDGRQSVTHEAGLDIFERQSDGRWSISRFMSFSTTPNAMLE